MLEPISGVNYCEQQSCDMGIITANNS